MNRRLGEMTSLSGILGGQVARLAEELREATAMASLALPPTSGKASEGPDGTMEDVRATANDTVEGI